MAEPRIKLVCFDLGGVAVRICRSLREACELVDLPYHADADTPELRQGRHLVALQHTVGELEDGTYYERMAEHTNGRYGPDEIKLIDDAWIVEPYPGIEQVVDELNAVDHLLTGCLSNTTREHWYEMAHVDEEERPRSGEPRFPAVPKMQHRAASHLLRLAKPDEAIYRAYEKATGVAGAEIIFFDDLAENIEAARAAGWNAEQIDHTGDTAEQVRMLLSRYGIELNHQSSRG
jgi:FMN phosphatase YigB (HAD superfamily)